MVYFNGYSQTSVKVWSRAPNDTCIVLNSTENKLNYVLVKCSSEKLII